MRISNISLCSYRLSASVMEALLFMSEVIVNSDEVGTFDLQDNRSIGVILREQSDRRILKNRNSALNDTDMSYEIMASQRLHRMRYSLAKGNAPTGQRVCRFRQKSWQRS